MAHWTEYTAVGAATWPTDFDYETLGGSYLKAGTQVYNNETYLWIFGQRESSNEGYYRNFNATTFTWGTRYRDPSGISQYNSDEVINNIQDGNDIEPGNVLPIKFRRTRDFGRWVSARRKRHASMRS